MRRPADAFGIRDAGGNLTTGGAGAAGVSMVLIPVHLPTINMVLRRTTAYIGVRYPVVPSAGKS